MTSKGERIQSDQIALKQIIEPHKFNLRRTEMHHQPSDVLQLQHTYILGI